MYRSVTDPSQQEIYGRLYAAVLQIQLTADFFVLFFPALLWFWPKGGAIAQAAFREGVRQPMYWLLSGLALLLMGISPFVPYFTFGEDHIMVKELGYDTIMLAGLAFGTLAASIFVSDEIEGRTALTVMSKPVSRRQFLMGKHVGILMAVVLMFAILGLWFEGVLLFKPWWDKADAVQTIFDGSLPFGKPPPWVNTAVASLHLQPQPSAVPYRLRLLAGPYSRDAAGAGSQLLPGHGAGQHRRDPGHAAADGRQYLRNRCYCTSWLTCRRFWCRSASNSRRMTHGSAVGKLVTFVAQLFDTLLPGLDFFKVGPTLISDAPPPAGPFWFYIASVVLLCAALLRDRSARPA